MCLVIVCVCRCLLFRIWPLIFLFDHVNVFMCWCVFGHGFVVGPDIASRVIALVPALSLFLAVTYCCHMRLFVLPAFPVPGPLECGFDIEFGLCREFDIACVLVCVYACVFAFDIRIVIVCVCLLLMFCLCCFCVVTFYFLCD